MGERMQGRRDPNAFVEVMGDLVTETVTVVDGEVTEVFLGGEPKRPVRVYGVVSRAGEALAGAQVFAVSEGSAVFEGMKTASSADDGSYELVVDRPGPHTISATYEQIGVQAVVEVPRADELRVDLAVPLGRIEGVVRKPGAGRAAGVRLSLQREDGLGRVRWAGDQNRADEEGRYSFDDLEAGRYTVRANVAGWGGQAESAWGTAVRTGIVVEHDRATSGVDFELEKAGSVEGLVKSPDGRPLASASLFFRGGAGLISSVSGTVSDATGRFRREGLAPGTYTISARAEGFALGDAATVVVAADEVSQAELTLEVGTMVLVTLEDAGDAARIARVEMLDDAGNDVGNLLTLDQLRSSFNSGTSSLERRVGPIAPGRYTVRATTIDGRSVEKRVTLRGREAEKKVRLGLDDE